MSRHLLQKRLLASAESSLAFQRADGGLTHNHNMLMIATWAICFTENFPGNTRYQDPRVLDAIVRLGDYNARSLDAHGCFIADDCSMGGWDEWRYVAWLEAMIRVRPHLDQQHLDAWTKIFVDSGKHLMAMCIDMDTFDGGIPNHGTWSHVYAYRVGQAFGIKEYADITGDALQRVIASQTADGVWREGQSAGGFQGTPVTLYNLVSASAISLHHHHTGNKAAATALDRAWHWYYDFLLPDGSFPPTLDVRTKYSPGPVGAFLPGYFYNIPQGRFCAEQHWQNCDQALRTKPPHEHWPVHRSLGFDALQYDQMRDDVVPEKPAWPEYRRMISEEACVRRRHGWTAVLSGMTNLNLSNVGTRLFEQERQDAVNIHHEKLGLLIGSCHSKLDPDLSTFVLFDTGKAHYLPDGAYLKSTPPRDSLLLRYGSNVATVSVDSRQADSLAIEFSLLGERGRAERVAPGHPISAMGARAHLSLRLTPGETLRHNDKTWTLPGDDGSALHLRLLKGDTLDLGLWTLTCDEPWELRWPVRPIDPYTLESPVEWIAVAQVTLYPAIYSLGGATRSPCRPTATFKIKIT